MMWKCRKLFVSCSRFNWVVVFSVGLLNAFGVLGLFWWVLVFCGVWFLLESVVLVCVVLFVFWFVDWLSFWEGF